MQAQEPNTRQPEFVLVCPCGAKLGLEVHPDESAVRCPQCRRDIYSPARPFGGTYYAFYDLLLPLLPEQRKFALISFVALGVVLATGLLLNTDAPQTLLDCGFFGLVGACAAFGTAIPLLVLFRHLVGVGRDQLPPTGPGAAIAIAWSIWFFFLSSQITGSLIGLAVGFAKLLLGDSLPGAGLSLMLAAAVAFALFRLSWLLRLKISVASIFTTWVLPGCAALLALAVRPSLRDTAWLVFPLVPLLGTFLIAELIHWATARYAHCLSIKWIAVQLMHTCTSLLLGMPATFAWLAVGSDPDQPWNYMRLEEMASLQGHTGDVFSVAFSPDGTILASGSKDKTIRLWDVKAREELKPLEGHRDAITSVAFSPDGKTLASASSDGTIKLWDIKSRKETATLRGNKRGHEARVMAVKFSPDRKTLASASEDNTIRLWDLATNQATKTLSGRWHGVSSVDFSSDGKLLASGSGDGTVRIWDPLTGETTKILSDQNAIVRWVAFGPDNKTVASASARVDKSIKIWDAVKLWDIETGQETRKFRGIIRESVGLSPDGKFLAASGSGAEVWNVETGRLLADLHHVDGRPYGPAIWTLAYSPDGTMLATGASDGRVRLWDMTRLK